MASPSIITIGLLAALGGCAGDRVHREFHQLLGVIPRPVYDVQVAPMFTESTQGTAIVLGPDTFLTCDHVVRPAPGRVHLLGEWRDVEILGRGTGAEWTDDWVLFRTKGTAPLLERPAIARDFDRPLEPGTAIFLVGHRGESVEWTTILPGEVLVPPARWNMPSDVAYAAVDMLPERTDEGMSGAAAVVIERDSGRPVIVGLLIGRATVSVNDTTVGYLRVLARPDLGRWMSPPFGN